MTRAIVIGLDGATWDVMNPLLEEGELPNIAGLMENGAYGVLKSLDPAFTPLIWTSIATGKTADKHGVTSFFDTALTCQAKRIWDIIEDTGKSIGLFCWPVTWPPRPVNGFMIPSVFARTPATYPAGLSFVKEMERGLEVKTRDGARWLWQGIRHGLSVGAIAEIARYVYDVKVRNLPALQKQCRRTALKLLIHQDIYRGLLRKFRPYFTFFYMYHTDSLSHLFWRYYQPQYFPDVAKEDIQKYGNQIPMAYKAADKAIGRILKELNTSTAVFVISDHGFERAKRDKREVSFSIKGNVLLDKIGLGDKASYVHYRHSILVRLNKNNCISKDAIKNLLAGIRIIGYDRRLFSVAEDGLGLIVLSVHEPEKYDTSTLQDLVVQLPNGTCRFLDIVEESHTRVSGIHNLDGVIIMKGNGIRRGVVIKNASVLDVAPTLLALMKLPVGSDMDGRVLKEAFEEEFLVKNPISCIPTYEVPKHEAETGVDESMPIEVLDRLRGLGYID